MITPNKTALCVIFLASSLLPALPASAEIRSFALPGTTGFDFWPAGNLNRFDYANNGTYPSFGSSNAAWPAPIDSRGAGSGDGVIRKVSNGAGGGPTLLSESLYFAGFSATPNTLGGILGVDDATPIANVKNVVLQIDVGQSFEARDFFNGVAPVLTYNGGSQNLAADTFGIFDRIDTGATFPVPGGGDETIFRATYLLQWNLAGIVDPITSLSVRITGVQHAQIYGVRLDQSDTYTAYVIPEPSALSLLALPAIALLRRKK